MKILFAVNNEEISESIVKKYQREYKEIISYKNVYYFNAILKEIQKDKSYDVIIISEELESFTHTQYDQIDKFIFEKLDNISDEASKFNGEDIPIILICADRRNKSDSMLAKLFGIGIYSALIGQDRNVTKLCELIHKPRNKKDAKTYYKIETDDIIVGAEGVNDVSEVEIQNILAHYKRLGKNEEKYIESFDNIASQYNDIQLKIICKYLPINVKAVLEERSSKYQKIMAFNAKVSDQLRNKNIKKGTSEKLLKSPVRDTILTKPVVVPNVIDTEGRKKLSKPKNVNTKPEKIIEIEKEIKVEKPKKEVQKEEIQKEEIEEKVALEEKPKKKRGRPRKKPIIEEKEEEKPKKKRGRPRKNPIVKEQIEIEDKKEEIIMPGIDEEEIIMPEIEEELTMPGIDEEEIIMPEIEEEIIMPGIDEKETTMPEIEKNDENFDEDIKPKPITEKVDISNLLTSNKKIAAFVGTTKNGTSFIVNNVAEILAEEGVNVAILDTTKNKNSYYIYTDNEEELRETARNCFQNLNSGIAKGIEINRNLTIYTGLPEDNIDISNSGKVLETLLSKHSVILIDCDFKTDIGYFEDTQELYLVQTLDILTIQPLTAFLRELKAKNILKEEKLRVVLNKKEKLKSINDKIIIGGMASYNDPSMSYMVDLFNESVVKYISIPFEEEVYVRYLEGLINCDISVKKYPKDFVQVLKELGTMIYPKANTGANYTPPTAKNTRFSPSMNSTLDQMRKY